MALISSIVPCTFSSSIWSSGSSNDTDAAQWIATSTPSNGVRSSRPRRGWSRSPASAVTRPVSTARPRSAGLSASNADADSTSRAGLSHPTLLYHFKSKEALYAAVIAAAVADWAHDTEAAASAGLSGFAQVEAILDAGFGFLATHRDFVRIVRREALDGGGRLEEMLSGHARPFVDRAVAFLEREMA